MNHDLEVAKAEAVEFYSQTVNAWYGTAMEFDRTLVTLSAGAIALLVGLATAGNIAVDRLSAGLYCAALVCFSISLGCMLAVFKRNRKYIERMVEKRNSASGRDFLLSSLDWLGLVFFGLGAMLTVFVAVSAIFSKADEKKADSMSDKPKVTESVPCFDSVLGAKALAPDFGRSFNGAASLQPKLPTTGSGAPSGTSSTAQNAPVQTQKK